MPRKSLTHSRETLVSVLALAAAWLLPVTLAAMQTRLRTLATPGQTVTWLDAFLFQLPLWSPLLVVAPFAFRVARRFRFDSRPRVRRLGMFCLYCVGLAVLYLLMSAAVSVAVERRPISIDTVSSAAGALVVRTFHLNLFIVAALMAAGYARDNHQRMQREVLRAANLREQLTEARLSTLKAQLRPHFLFNVLHSISSLVDEDRSAAQEMIAALSDLLRHTLRAVDGQRTELRHELVSVDLYLAIEKIRFQDRLRVEHAIAPEALSAQVPSLLLQPLVENAVLHGVEKQPGPSLIELRATVEDQTLELIVSNTRDAPEASTDVRLAAAGIGLGNTRARLDRLYSGMASVDLVTGPGTVKAVVRLPFTTASALLERRA